MKNKTEILSPVGSKEMLIAAVRSGADAVYLGAKEFSARRNAQNFDLTELKEAVEYCHIRGVRVYLALNILIKDREFSSAFNLAKEAYNTGVDGVIIQDLGLARVLKEKIPQLNLHASTQISVHSPSALPILKKMGFCQVVAAREMSKDDLIALCKKAKELEMVVEVFVHGALCMCLSGQCLLSAYLGSRSGNRGLCAGPCRLPFKVKGGTGYDLSLKDLSLLNYLKELNEIGIGSFKIEGRMKRPEYVAAATTACRQALDKGVVEPWLDETLKNVFSRSGFTAGYYLNKLGKDMFGVRTKDDVLSADKTFPVLHELYRGERKSVPIGIKAEIVKNKPITLTLTDNDGNSVTVTGDVPRLAENKPLTYENALKNICKFGSTPYFDEGGGIKLDDGLFVSAGELNELRRNAVEKLDNIRKKSKNILSNAEYERKTTENRKTKKQRVLCRFENALQIPKHLNFIDGIILPLEENPIEINDNIEKIVDIPRGILNESVIRKRLKLFAEKGFHTALCGNLSAVEIAKKQGFKILGDTGLNVANSECVNTFRDLGACAVTVSSEHKFDEGEIKGEIPVGVSAYGHIPLMIFKNCPLKNGISCKDCNKDGVITDRLGVEFPVRCRMGYSEMLNPVPIWLADRLEEIENYDYILLYFSFETPQRVKEVIKAYKNGFSPDIKHTRGLYYRGTI